MNTQLFRALEYLHQRSLARLSYHLADRCRTDSDCKS